EDFVINRWWKIDGDKEEAPFGVVQGAITISPVRNEIKAYEGKETHDGKEVYRFSIKNGNYKTAELITLSGQLFRIEEDKKISYYADKLIPSKKYIYYDLGVPYLKPSYSTDETGEKIEDWEDPEYRGITYDEKTRIQTQKLRIKNPLFGKWENSLRHSDEYGDFAQLSPENSILGKTWIPTPFSFFAGILIAAFPLSILIKSHLDGEKWKKWWKKLESKFKKTRPDEFLYDEEIQDEAYKRIIKKVLKTTKEGMLSSGDGNYEIMFTKEIVEIYALTMARLKKGDPNLNLQDDSHPLLSNMDKFFQEAAEYFAKEIARGGVKVVKVKTAEGTRYKIDGDVRYQILGIPDHEIWGKLKLYLNDCRTKLRKFLSENDIDRFKNVLDEIGISRGEFSYEHFKEFLNKEGFSYLPPIDKEVEEIVHNAWKSKRFLTDKEKAKIDGYSRKFRGIRARNFLGIGTKSIHGIALEIASFLPYALILGVAVSALYGSPDFSLLSFLLDNNLILFGNNIGHYSSLLSLSAAATAVIGIISGYKHTSRFSRLGQGEDRKGKVARVALGGASLLIAILFISLPVPSLGAEVFLGAVVLKNILGAVFLAEAIGYFLWSRPLLGLSMFRFYRPSIGLASSRTRTRTLHFLQYFSFVIIGLVMAECAFPWFATHYLVVPTWRVVFAGATFISYAYMMHYGLWIGFTSLLATLSPTHGPKINKENLQKFMSAEETDSSIGIIYVGPLLFSKGIFVGAGATQEVMDAFQYLIDEDYPPAKILWEEIKREEENADDKEVIERIKESLDTLYEKEKKYQVPLWSLRQIEDSTLLTSTPECYIPTKDAEERRKIKQAFCVRRLVTLMTSAGGGAGGQIDTATNILDMAEQ
ncbi:hypothetical protein DRH14_05460, partial [Candidatus Shapirobacteria bacterium]